MRLQTKLAGGLAALAILPSAAHAAYIYAPGPEYETQEGDVNNVALNIYVAEKQWFFNSSLFGNSPMTINSVSFRLDKIVSDREFQRMS